MVCRCTIGLLLLLPIAVVAAAEPVSVTLTLAPGDSDRVSQVVRFPLPPGLRGPEAMLRDAGGAVVPLQVGADGQGTFIVARQAAGEPLRYELQSGTAPDQRMVQVSEDSSGEMAEGSGIAAATDRSRAFAAPDRLRVSVGGRPVLYYRMVPGADPLLRPAGSIGGVLQPVLTPRELPVVSADPSEGGMRSFLGSIRRGDRLIDFATLADGEIGFEFGDVETTWNGGVEGGLSAWHRWIDPATDGAEVLLDETWEVTAYSEPATLDDFSLFDLQVTQTNVSPDGSDLAWVEPGGLEIAGNPVWRSGAGPLRFNLRGGPGDESRWAGLGGSDGTNSFSVVVFVPSGESGPLEYSFEVDASRPGIRVRVRPLKETLAAGDSLEWQVRIASFDSIPSPQTLAALWHGFVDPAEVAIEADPQE